MKINYKYDQFCGWEYAEQLNNYTKVKIFLPDQIFYTLLNNYEYKLLEKLFESEQLYIIYYAEIFNQSEKIYKFINIVNYNSFIIKYHHQKELIPKGLIERYLSNLENKEINKISNSEIIDGSDKYLDIIYKIPPDDYQYEAIIKGLACQKLGIFMKQGLGKTKTVIDIAQNLLHQRQIQGVVALVPAGVFTNWQKELSQYCLPEYEQYFQLMSIGETSTMDENSNNPLLVNLEAINNGDVALIIDESHNFKNPESLRSLKLLDMLSHDVKIFLLTGTPYGKNRAELYTTLRLLGVYDKTYYELLAECFKYSYDQYENVKVYGEQGDKFDYYINELSKVSIWMTKDKLNLAPKNYHIENYQLSSLQKSFIDYFWVEAKQELNELNGYAKHIIANINTTEKMIKKALIQRMLQVQAGFMSKVDKDTGQDKIEIFTENPKLRVLEKILTTIGDDFVIIFCVYHTEIKIIEQLLLKMGLSYLIRTGKNTKTEKGAIIESFQKGKGKILLATTESSGTGVNAFHCNQIIYFTNNFNPITRDQSEDRIHRRGQTRDCHIWDILAEKTADEAAYLTCKKRIKNLEDTYEFIKNNATIF